MPPSATAKAPRRALTPSTSLVYPAGRGPARVTAPDWSRVSDEEVAAEYLRRTVEQPLLLWQAGLSPRRAAFATTLRGTCAVFGGTQSAKTVGVGVPWGAALVEGLHPMMACPESCPQYGTGTCGLHCCPIPERGSALVEGCVGGTTLEHARACAVHPPLWWPEPRVLLVGVLNFSKWNEALVPAFERYLGRYPDDSPRWRLDKADHAIIDQDKRYRIQAVSYDDPDRNESTSPIGILDDEIPPANVYNFQVYRAAVRNTQIKICGTTFDLLSRPHQAAWLFPQIIQKTGSPIARAQVFHLRTLDNLFLEPASRKRYAELGEQLLADGRDQEKAIRLDGVPQLRQDACFFSQTTIRRQGARILTPQRWYVSMTSQVPTGDDLPYFRGPSTFPAACELSDESREALIARRAGTIRGGVGCYDCLAPCAAFVAPPMSARVLSFDLPTLQRERPKRGEWHAVDIFHPPQHGHRYAAGGDNAKGDPGGDYNVFDIFDVHTGSQAAQYHGQTQPHVFTAIMFAMWRAYRPFIVSELNGFGVEIMTRLMTEYHVPVSDIFHRLDHTRKSPAGDPLPMPGWWTTRGTKQDPGGDLASPYGDIPSPIGLYERMLRTGRLQLHSARSHAQLGAFVMQAGRLGALAGSHDDTVISGALASLAFYLVQASLERRPGLLALPGMDQPIGPHAPPTPPPPGERWRDPDPPRGDIAPPVRIASGARAARRW